MAEKTVLVTGGAGFIGTHLCRRLLAEGKRVVCVDSLCTGREENAAELKKDSRFVFIRHDVVEPIDVAADEIYVLACPASPTHYQADPVHTAKTIVYGAVNALELARRYGARILRASTSEIYGEPLVHPQPEEYRGNVNPTGIRACYDEGKRMAETLFFDYAREYGTDVRVARIFNTYGPGMRADDGRVFSNFIVQALRGDDLTVYGDGSQTRSPCYVSDTVDALVRLMEAGGVDGPVNIGNPAEYTVGALAEQILRETGSASRIVYRDLPQDDPTHRCPDIGRARRLLGWEPRVPLPEGLRETVAWFRAHPD